MSAVANSSHYENKGGQSGAIGSGADLLLSLFETEKAKVTAESHRQLKEVEARFSEYRRSSEQRINELGAVARHTNAMLARSVADGSLAREQMLEAQQQSSQLMIELSQLRDSLKEAGLSWNPKSLKLTRVEMADVMMGDVLPEAKEQAEDLDRTSDVEALQNRLAEARETLEDQKRTCIRVEQERDDLRAAMGSRDMILKDRILSLQNEVERLKRGSQLHGIQAIQKSVEISRPGVQIKLSTIHFDLRY